MNLQNVRNKISSLFVTQKAQSAVYPLNAAGKNDSELGQEVPRSYPVEIREKLYRTPIVFMAINAIAEHIAKVDWEIVPKKSVLEQFGYGTREGRNNAVLSAKEWMQFSTKYTSTDRQELSSATKSHIEKVYALLEDPNENSEGFSAIRKKIAIDLKLHDAAAIEKIYNGKDEVAEIYTAPAPYIRMNYDKNGKLLDPAYIQYDPKFPKAKLAEWTKEEMSYFMLNPISTSMYGVSPVDIVAQTVATLINALNYNGTYFESAALPEGYFTLPGLTSQQAKRLMQQWEQQIKGKHHKVVFLPEGANWHQFRFTNEEMQWLQGQKFYMELVMAVLGVTKNELGFTDDISKATSDNLTFVFKNRSVIPILNLLAEKINQDLIGRTGFGYDDVMFVFKNVDLADKEALDKIHDRAVKSGRMTINEAREESGHPPYQGFGNEPVIATSQGLIFLEQFGMKFDEFKEEYDWLKEQAEAAGVPVAEMRRRLAQQNNPNVPGSQDESNNSDSQPKTPPSPANPPKADEKPDVDESEKQANAILVEGLNKIANKIDEALNEEK